MTWFIHIHPVDSFHHYGLTTLLQEQKPREKKTFTFTIDALRWLWPTGLGDSAIKAGDFTFSVLILGENLQNWISVLFTADSLSFIHTSITVHGQNIYLQILLIKQYKKAPNGDFENIFLFWVKMQIHLCFELIHLNWFTEKNQT